MLKLTGRRVRLLALKTNTKLRSPESALEPASDAGSARALLVMRQHCAVFAPLALGGGWRLETTAHRKLPFRTQDQIHVSPDLSLSIVYQPTRVTETLAEQNRKYNQPLT